MAILNPTPDSFDLGLATVLGSKSKYHPSLDAFNSSLYLEGSDTPFANVEIPAVHADDGAVSNVNQTVNIGNQTGFGDYAKTVFKNETVTLVVKGKTGLHEGKLPATTVTYDKQITMKGAFLLHTDPLSKDCPALTMITPGLNSLKGFAVTSFQILLTTQPDGSNMLGTIYIPNPTVMTIEMGTITLLLSIAGTPIGVATLNNLTLVPGNNTIQMRSKTDQGAVIKYLLQPQYRSGILPVDIVGNSSVFNGQQLPYFQNALEQNKMAVDLNVGQALIQAGLGSLLGLGGSGTSSSITAPAGPRSEGTSSSASTAESGSGTTASSTAAPSGSGSARTPTTSPTAAPAASGSGTTTTS